MEGVGMVFLLFTLGKYTVNLFLHFFGLKKIPSQIQHDPDMLIDSSNVVA